MAFDSTTTRRTSGKRKTSVPSTAGSREHKVFDSTHERNRRARVYSGDVDYFEDQVRQRNDQIKSARRKYYTGQYGASNMDQAYYGTDGDSHEAEHIIGASAALTDAPFPDEFDRQGKKKPLRKTKLGGAFERELPAYQESEAFHRDHIGTGCKPLAEGEDEPGFSSESFRKSQSDLLRAGDVSSAVQLNQLGYAYLDGFQDDTEDLRKADDSYDAMVGAMSSVDYFTKPERGKPTTRESAEVDRTSKQEMLIAREIARTGVWPVDAIARLKENGLRTLPRRRRASDRDDSQEGEKRARTE